MHIERIRLKERSPEYADEADRVRKNSTKSCAMDGCMCEGTHQAPTDKSLKSYHWLCYEHVKAYNAAWDFFAGLTATETEAIYRETIYGERPTRKMHANEDFLAQLRFKAFDFGGLSGFTSGASGFKTKTPDLETPDDSPVGKALKLFGLSLSATTEMIKQAYRTKVKEWHPDRHGGSHVAEEELKKINMAYTLLKARFERVG